MLLKGSLGAVFVVFLLYLGFCNIPISPFRYLPQRKHATLVPIDDVYSMQRLSTEAKIARDVNVQLCEKTPTNYVHRIVQQNLTSALILEDDAD